jgi:hypothetical protein
MVDHALGAVEDENVTRKATEQEKKKIQKNQGYC